MFGRKKIKLYIVIFRFEGLFVYNMKRHYFYDIISFCDIYDSVKESVSGKFFVRFLKYTYM